MAGEHFQHAKRWQPLERVSFETPRHIPPADRRLFAEECLDCNLQIREAVVDTEGTLLPDSFEVMHDPPFTAEAFELLDMGNGEPVIEFRMNPGAAVDPPFPITWCPALRLPDGGDIQLVFVHELS